LLSISPVLTVGQRASHRENIMRQSAACIYAGMLAAVLTVPSLAAQAVPKRTAEQIQASYDAHHRDFDYLLGDWEFTSVSKEHGKGRGFWSAVRLSEGGQILDEYRVVGDNGETWYVSSTLRAYNGVLDRWELVSAEGATGLQDVGTGRKVGDDMRYFNIRPDRFSWRADRSVDGGKTWQKDHLQIEARRIGPARSLAPLAPARNTRTRR
jgi:hypothetical protein